MTSTSVKDVNAAAVNLVPGMKGRQQPQAAEVTFQTVWNSQTEKGATPDSGDRKPVDKAEPVQKDGDAPLRKADGGKSAESAKPEKAEALQNQEGEEVQLPDEKDLEQAMEVLETAAVQMVQQIADTLGVEVQEVQAAMEGLGMQDTDVLDPQMLGSLLLELGGAQDSTALLTDEALYGDYRTLMDAQNALLEDVGDTLGMDTRQVRELLEQTGTQPEVVPQVADVQGEAEIAEPVEPKVEITMEPVDVQTGAGTETVQDPEAQDASRQGQRDHAKDHHPEGRGQETNFFTQNFERVEAWSSEAPVAETGSAQDVDTQNIMRQILDYMKIRLGSEVSDVEMQLHPASLGTLQIHVAAKGGILTANFVTENEAVKAALESQMIQLKESFAEQGMKVEAIEVTVQTHQFEQNLEQGRGRGQEEQSGVGKRSRTRRIDLNALSGMEEGELEEEDRIAADMMAANGNTVDYTA